jgi:hypothetical protein
MTSRRSSDELVESNARRFRDFPRVGRQVAPAGCRAAPGQETPIFVAETCSGRIRQIANEENPR